MTVKLEVNRAIGMQTTCRLGGKLGNKQLEKLLKVAFSRNSHLSVLLLISGAAALSVI